MDLTKLSTLVGSVRDLTPAERELYDNQGPATWPEVKQISARHHRIAQLLASGYKHVEVARAVGCTNGTVSRLVASPAFSALVQKYVEEAFDDQKTVLARMQTIALDSLDLLHERVVTKDIENKDLINATSDLFDRTGFGKTSTIKHEDRRYLEVHEIREIKETYKKEATRRLGLGPGNDERSIPSPASQEPVTVAAEWTEVREGCTEGTQEGLQETCLESVD
jgi:hypothetical protein